MSDQDYREILEQVEDERSELEARDRGRAVAELREAERAVMSAAAQCDKARHCLAAALWLLDPTPDL